VIRLVGEITLEKERNEVIYLHYINGELLAFVYDPEEE
jgi:hypothetical protein